MRLMLIHQLSICFQQYKQSIWLDQYIDAKITYKISFQQICLVNSIVYDWVFYPIQIKNKIYINIDQFIFQFQKLEKSKFYQRKLQFSKQIFSNTFNLNRIIEILRMIQTISNPSLKFKRHIQNMNKQIQKNFEHTNSALMKIQTILGIQNFYKQQQLPFQTPQFNSKQQNKSSQTQNNKTSQFKNLSNSNILYPLISLNDQEILYYSCKYFIIYNLSTKEYQIINKDIKNYQLVQIKKFNTTDNDKKLIVGVYQSLDLSICNHTLLSLLTIKTDYESRTSRNDSRYQWKVIKLCNQAINVQDYCLFPKKNYIYLITTKPIYNQKNQIQRNIQYIWIYDLNKELMLINQQIRSNTIGFYIKNLVLEDSNVIYLVGKNYFRQWTVNFNQKSIKESNARNVERVLKNKVIINVQEVQKYCLKQQSHSSVYEISELNPHLQNNEQILSQPSKLLIILTQNEVILVKNNQLISTVKPQRNLSKNAKNKDNIEKQLENSFNQIYKMKFLFDQYEQMKSKQIMKDFDRNKKHDTILMNQNATFSCMSKCWRSQNQNVYIAIATSKLCVLIYQIVDFQLKLDTQYNYSKDIITSLFRSIIPTQGGDVLLIMSQNKQVHMINQQSYDTQDDLNIKSLWGNGQLHSGKVYSLTSPMIQNIMCSVGEDGTFKLWTMKKNQRSILFQERTVSKPYGVTIHPGGTMIAVNFERQIKLFSILPKQFYEITSIKTNYSSIQLKYSHRGEFLVSNEGSILLFYQPFSLRTLGYIQPAQLKCRIIDFKLTKNSQYICFITEDCATYFSSIDIGELSKWQHIQPVHYQNQLYTAFHFDFCNNSEDFNQKNISEQKKYKNLFIGATKTKYMILYQQYGSKLLAQFPIIDCWIVDIEVYENLLFAATSKGTIRVYNWPILQQNLQLQIINSQEKKIRFKPPHFDQYQIWNQGILISKIHKLNFSNQIVIVNEQGNMGILSFQQTKNKKIVYEQVSGQRKKMEQLINQMFYIKKNETQKRNKLIQKTENDILKVQNEILREKISLQRKMQEQENSVEKGFEVKNHIQETEKNQYISKQYQEIQVLKSQIKQKKSQFQLLKQTLMCEYQSKKIYENSRNLQVKQEVKQVIKRHKQKIRRKIQKHKQEIKEKKKQYLVKIKEVQKQFEGQIQKKYEDRIKELNEEEQKKIKLRSSNQNHQNQQKCDSGLWLDFNSHVTSQRQSKLKRMSVTNLKSKPSVKAIKTMEQELNDQIIQQLTSKQNEQIVLQSCRVDQLQTNNYQLKRQIQVLKKKVQQMQNQDESLQKDFQKNLQEYNLSRFLNLNLHSEVLKMQNQLIQRKQVLDNKEQIVMLAYQQKQKLQNYKQLVKGSLGKLQQKKQNTRDVFFKKQNDLNNIFSQLINEIHKMENRKGALQKLQRKIHLSQKQKQEKQGNLNEIIQKLKEIKKFLLLQRMNQEKSQKFNYQFQQSLLNTINFLKKRLFMQSIKEKKNKQLKKSALGQILKQNKNLLQECNQLRSQGIEYENEIKNLSNKLKQANKMITIETKLKSQKNDLSEQKNQLDVIKQLFQMQLNQFSEQEDQDKMNVSKQGQIDESQVHYDAQKAGKTHKPKHKVVFNCHNTFNDQQNNGFKQYKPFKLSGYIEAQPFQRIEL